MTGARLAPAAPGLVAYRDAGPTDAIAEHGRRLVAALAASGVPAAYEGEGLRPILARAGPAPPWILLQYNPNSYGRRGVAPGLVRDVLRLRRRTPSALLLCVHEPWTYVHDARSLLMTSWHRLQLRPLLAAADGVGAVTAPLARRLGHGAVHVGVGTNVTPVAVARDEARRRLAVGDALVVVLFGGAHPSRAHDHAAAALAALAAQGADRLLVLNLGAGAPAPSVPEGVAVRSPGPLTEAELSLHLLAGDLALLPLVDGLSTRRTTLMAALAHGLPVAGLRGPGTDPLLAARPDAVALTPAGDRGAYARAVVALADDPAVRSALGRAGRRLYERELDWPVVARRVTRALDDARRARATGGRRARRARTTARGA